MAPLSNLAARDVENLVHPYTNLATFRENGPMVIERGEGVYVYDTQGKRYLEGMAGLWCTALGYGNEELVDGRVNESSYCGKTARGCALSKKVAQGASS